MNYWDTNHHRSRWSASPPIDLHRQNRLSLLSQQVRETFSSRSTSSPSHVLDVVAGSETPTDTEPVAIAPVLEAEVNVSRTPISTDPPENAEETEALDRTPPSNDTQTSDDDFRDLPSEFDDDDLPLDDAGHTNDDIEFLRNAAKTFMSSLSDMEDASANTNSNDSPRTLFYGDDYVVTIQNRQFAIAFLDYTQFRIDKQRNPEKFRLLASLKKTSTQRKRTDHEEKQLDHASLASPPATQSLASTIEPELLSMIESKGNKKKRSKRNKKKKFTNQHNNTGMRVCRVENPGNANCTWMACVSLSLLPEKPERTSESVQDEDDGDDNTIHVLNDQESDTNGLSLQRLPHVYLDDDLKPCIVVAGEENGHETSEHEDWHDIKAGGKSAPVPKKAENQKSHPQTEESKTPVKQVEEVSGDLRESSPGMVRDVSTSRRQQPRYSHPRRFTHWWPTRMAMRWLFQLIAVASFTIPSCSKPSVCDCVDPFQRSVFVSNRLPIASPSTVTWKPTCNTVWPISMLSPRTNDWFVLPSLSFLRPRRAMSYECNSRLPKWSSTLTLTTIESFGLLLVSSIINWNSSTINSSAFIVDARRISFSSPICNFQRTNPTPKSFKQLSENAFSSCFRHGLPTSPLPCREIWSERNVGWASTRVWPSMKTWTKPCWSEKSIRSFKSTVCMPMCKRSKLRSRASSMPIDLKRM